MKTKYALVSVATICIATDLCNRLFYENEYLLSTINNALNVLLKIGIILLAYTILRDMIKYCIQREKHKTVSQKSLKMQEIEREMDEIEGTLDIVTKATRENGKIVPIWKIDCKEP